MPSRIYSLLFVVLFCVVTFVPKAHASTMAASLARMDAIIKEIQALREEFARLSSSPIVTPTPSVLGATAKSFFTQSLALGETNSDIKKIQKLLATDKEVYPYGVASGLFGPKTEEAIKNFQTRFGLKPVGVVGPATKALFEVFFAAYPNDIYPADVLKKKPMMAQVAVVPVAQSSVVISASPTTPNNSGFKIITASYTGSKADVKVVYTDGTKKSLVVTGDSKLKIVDAVAFSLGQTKAIILSHIEFVSSNDDQEEDEVENEDNNDDEIKSIVASIEDGEATIEVKYENGDDETFTVEEDKEAEIIEEVANELNIDEDEVEDIIEFEYQDIEDISVVIKGGKALATIEFEDGTTKRIKVSSDDEGEIIEAIAEELGEDEGDIEDIITFN